MAVTTVGDVMRRAKAILQEAGTGIRWADPELLDWLNEAYMSVVRRSSSANSVAAMLDLVAGARQALPADGLRVLRLNRNGNGMAMMPTTLATLNGSRRNWYGEPATDDVEQFVIIPDEPTAFYVYPPASDSASAEVVYVKVPKRHKATKLATVEDDTISVRDEYAQALVDYVLFRAFSKDAEGQNNAARASAHYQAFELGVGGGAQQGGAA